MKRKENSELKEEISALQAHNEALRKDRGEWETLAAARLAEIRRLRQIILAANGDTDSVYGTDAAFDYVSEIGAS
jgi:hypothetical protein